MCGNVLAINHLQCVCVCVRAGTFVQACLA